MNGCWIVGSGAVCSLGQGVEAVYQAWRQGQCGLKPMTQFDPRRYQSAIAGETVGRVLPAGLSRARILAQAAMEEALACAQSAGVPEACWSRALVVLATTKGTCEPLERFIHGDLPVRPSTDPLDLIRPWLQERGFGGPMRTLSLACASGAAALAHAAEALEQGWVQMALVVGVDELSDFVLTGFSSLKSLDPQACRPFDAQRQGLSLGEAGAAVILAAPGTVKAKPGGCLLGWGLANDATHLTAPNREGLGLARAMERSLHCAHRQPREIHYVNAHGTGTAYNDAMEAKAMEKVFGSSTPPVSTIKGSTGHTLGAAGVLETVVTLAALRQGEAPATRGLETPGVSESIDLILGNPRALPPHPVALSLSAGFGGFNVSLVLAADAEEP